MGNTANGRGHYVGTTMKLTVETALKIIQAVIEAARAQNLPLAASVVDTGGRVLASARTETAGYVNLDVAEKKAATAVNFGASSQAVLKMIEGEPFLLSAVMQEANLSLIPGGFPIHVSGELVGGLGIAGARYTLDQALGEKILASL